MSICEKILRTITYSRCNHSLTSFKAKNEAPVMVFLLCVFSKVNIATEKSSSMVNSRRLARALAGSMSVLCNEQFAIM